MLFQITIFVATYLWARRSRIRIRRVIPYAIVALPIVYVLWMVFLGLRVDSYGDAFLGKQERTIFERLETTTDMLSEEWDSVRERQSADIVRRIFVIGYLGDLIGGTRETSPLLGLNLFVESLEAMPRVLFPPKTEILDEIGRHEDLINANFGLPEIDRATSIVTGAYADFLWWGIILVPPIVLLLGISFAKLASVTRSEFMRVFAVSYVFYTGLSTESAFFTFTLGSLRTVLSMALAILFLRMLNQRPAPVPALRTRKPTR